jgi:hypothetical protein
MIRGRRWGTPSKRAWSFERQDQTTTDAPVVVAPFALTRSRFW